jgi:hypothetical protein
MSIKTEIFTSKEHYLAFRKAFARAANTSRAKPHFIPCDEIVKNPETNEYIVGKSADRNIQRKGWMTASHFAFLNLIRGKTIQSGFTITTNKKKLINGRTPHYGFWLAIENLNFFCSKNLGNWARKRQENFLEPFEGTVTAEMLEKLSKHIPHIHSLSMWGAKGSRVIPALMKGEMGIEEFWKEVIDENQKTN